MLIGALIARLTIGITTGNRVEAVNAQISVINSRPCDEVAVMVDTRDPLAVSELPNGVEIQDYVNSWQRG